MKLKYYFAVAVIASSVLFAAVYLGWIETSGLSLLTLAVPLLLLGASAAWFIDELDRRLTSLSRTAGSLAENAGAATPARDSVTALAHSLEGVQLRVTELQARIDQQHTIAEHAPDAMWVYHVEGVRIIDVNQRFLELSGYTREQLVGMSAVDLGPSAQGDGTPTEEHARDITRRALEGELVVVPWTLCTRQGSTVACELRCTRLPSTPGRTLIGGTLIDVSERQRAEQELAYRLSFEALISRLSTEMISLASSEIDVGVHHALAEIGRFAKADRSYVFRFDERGERVSCTHEWCAPGIEPQLARLQNLETSSFPWAMQRLRSGEILHVPRVSEVPDEAITERREWEAESIRSLLLVPMRPTPTVPGYVGFDWVKQEKRWPPEFIFLLTIFGEMVSNLLARQRTDRELQRQHEALERTISELTRSNSELQRFAYAASHDLQEPLRAISGFSDLLARRYRGKLDPTADEYLSFMRDAVVRMRNMIHSLLEYSRIDASPRPFERSDLNEVMRLALSNLHASIEELHAQVQVEPLPIVMGDASQLLQLLQNLVSNAVKFHGDTEPEVQVRAQKQDGEWLLSIRDNGIGLAAEDTERVFEVFKRLHPSDRYPGSGIGLSVCKRIIERHRGRIWAEPNAEGGSTFFFTLPELSEVPEADTTRLTQSA